MKKILKFVQVLNNLLCIPCLIPLQIIIHLVRQLLP